MNKIEESFVNTFVLKNRRERSIFELNSESKRGRFLSRLCHNYVTVFDARYFCSLEELGADSTALWSRLAGLGAGSHCQVISCNQEVDGKRVALKDAITATQGFGLPSILICVPDSLAYFEGEQQNGAPPRFLLVKQRNS